MLRDEVAHVATHFDKDALRRICVMPERDFGKAFDMDEFHVDQPAPDHRYFFKDNGAKVLFVAHLDTVGHADDRRARFVKCEDGWVVFSRALDDRLGAYVGLELLPKLGVTYDILLTVGEETGRSTAAFFEPPKDYNWIIEFDRGGTDVVLYDYEEDTLVEMVEQTGARVGIGAFSDISYMEHLGVKGLNWGVGYRDYHGPRSHAFLDDTFKMVARFLRFDAEWHGVTLPHIPKPRYSFGSWGLGYEKDEDESAWWAQFREENAS